MNTKNLGRKTLKKIILPTNVIRYSMLGKQRLEPYRKEVVVELKPIEYIGNELKSLF